jgi:hypothetical protein
MVIETSKLEQNVTVRINKNVQRNHAKNFFQFILLMVSELRKDFLLKFWLQEGLWRRHEVRIKVHMII